MIRLGKCNGAMTYLRKDVFRVKLKDINVKLFNMITRVN